MSDPVGFAYATAADLAAYVSPDSAPAGINARDLREATAQVDEMLLTAVYRVDVDGMPTDPVVAAALRDATCAQALHVNEYGDAAQIAAEGQPVTLGPLTIGSRSGSGGSSVPVWAPKALAHLRAAGLIVGPVQ